jgi:hypothetical protein
MTQCLPSKNEVLSLNPSAAKKNKVLLNEVRGLSSVLQDISEEATQSKLYFRNLPPTVVVI